MKHVVQEDYNYQYYLRRRFSVCHVSRAQNSNSPKYKFSNFEVSQSADLFKKLVGFIINDINPK